MLQNISSIIEAVLINYPNEHEKKDSISKFLQSYRSGMWIYPGIIRRKFELSINIVYLILRGLEKDGLIEGHYELLCGKCSHSTGVTYRVFNEIPEKFICDLCDDELIGIENATLIFKVL